MKAIIPAAGLGTRCLPLSKAVPKELIPVNGLPVLHHIVAEAKEAGCHRIGIVCSEGKEAIRRYFAPDPDLFDLLDRQGKRHLMAPWESLMDGLEFTWILQEEQKGLGHAIRCAENFANGDPVAVLLGDTLMEGASPLAEMVARHHSTGRAQVAIEPVEHSLAVRYGVCGGQFDPGGFLEIDTMIEKPSESEIPQARDPNGEALPNAYAFAARYLLTPEVFAFLATTPPGRNNEIQLTDAMAQVTTRSGFTGTPLPGKRHDISLLPTFGS